MKEGIHPNYQAAQDRLRLRQRHRDALDAAGDPRRALLRLPSVLHRQAEARGHGGSRRAVPEEVRQRSPERRRRSSGPCATVAASPSRRRGRGRVPRPFFVGVRSASAGRSGRVTGSHVRQARGGGGTVRGARAAARVARRDREPEGVREAREGALGHRGDRPQLSRVEGAAASRSRATSRCCTTPTRTCARWPRKSCPA